MKKEELSEIIATEISDWLDDKQFQVESLLGMGRAKLLTERIGNKLKPFLRDSTNCMQCGEPIPIYDNQPAPTFCGKHDNEPL